MGCSVEQVSRHITTVYRKLGPQQKEIKVKPCLLWHPQDKYHRKNGDLTFSEREP